MKFNLTQVQGVYSIDIELIADDRGFFARSFCVNEFKKYELNFDFTQCNVSFTAKKGTIRGMHYQVFPDAETKLIRCTKGAIYDVVVDLRSDSSTFKQWVTVELTSDNHRMLYVPPGCAHGFQTLVDDTEVFYQMAGEYNADAVRGVKWDDPAFGIEMPLAVSVINDRDRNYPGFTQ